MSEQLHELERRIESAEELHSITRTMRGLAAVNLRRYERSALAVNRYAAVVEEGLQVVLRDGGLARLPIEHPLPDAPTALVVFGSNQGLCGPVNRHVADHVEREAQRWPTLAHVGAVGARMAAELDVVGLSPTSLWELPGAVESIVARAEQVLLRAEAWRADDGVERIVVVFPDYRSRAQGYEPTTLQLWPTDQEWLERLAERPWRSRSLPTTVEPWEQLAVEMLRRSMFVRLHRSFTQTMASVAASRLAAMQTAQHDIEERIDRLQRSRRQLRQEQITDELLDVQTGFDVLQEPGRDELHHVRV